MKELIMDPSPIGAIKQRVSPEFPEKVMMDGSGGL